MLTIINPTRKLHVWPIAKKQLCHVSSFRREPTRRYLFSLAEKGLIWYDFNETKVRTLSNLGRKSVKFILLFESTFPFSRLRKQELAFMRFSGIYNKIYKVGIAM